MEKKEMDKNDDPKRFTLSKNLEMLQRILSWITQLGLKANINSCSPVNPSKTLRQYCYYTSNRVNLSHELKYQLILTQK